MIVHTLRWKPLLAAGLISGLMQVIAGVVMYLSGVYFAVWSGIVSLLLLAACIAAGTRWYVTRVLGGRTTYWTALLVGIVIAVVTGLVYATYNVVSISFVYPHFLEEMAQAEFARRRPGLDQSQTRQVLESLRARTTMGTIVVNNLRAFTAAGTVLAALVAVAFRKSGPR